jgi:hypothetical protein
MPIYWFDHAYAGDCAPNLDVLKAMVPQIPGIAHARQRPSEPEVVEGNIYLVHGGAGFDELARQCPKCHVVFVSSEALPTLEGTPENIHKLERDQFEFISSGDAEKFAASLTAGEIDWHLLKAERAWDHDPAELVAAYLLLLGYLKGVLDYPTVIATLGDKGWLKMAEQYNLTRDPASPELGDHLHLTQSPSEWINHLRAALLRTYAGVAASEFGPHA